MSDILLQDEVERFVKEHNILKKDFAAKIGVSPVKFSHWLKGRVAFNRITLEKIIAILDSQ
ncbi:MAG: helix-turn-helix transcriptional regulator [Clostridia bacterium]|nr:helix-turn-helix transcriptional regulator [Clostridia bacterium]